MNREQLFEAIGEINEVYINAERTQKKKPSHLKRFAAAAASRIRCFPERKASTSGTQAGQV